MGICCTVAVFSGTLMALYHLTSPAVLTSTLQISSFFLAETSDCSCASWKSAGAQSFQYQAPVACKFTATECPPLPIFVISSFKAQLEIQFFHTAFASYLPICLCLWGRLTECCRQRRKNSWTSFCCCCCFQCYCIRIVLVHCTDSNDRFFLILHSTAGW